MHQRSGWVSWTDAVSASWRTKQRVAASLLWGVVETVTILLLVFHHVFAVWPFVLAGIWSVLFYWRGVILFRRDRGVIKGFCDYT